MPPSPHASRMIGGGAVSWQAPRSRRGAPLFGRLRLELDVVLEAELLNEAELRLDEVDRLLLALEDVGEEIARRVVANAFGMRDRRAQVAQSLLLELQVAFEDLRHLLADEELVEVLEVGHALE